MATISIEQPHQLSQPQAMAAAERIARDLERRFHLGWHWEDDAIHFERPGVSGRMRIGDRTITLVVRLGLLLSPLRSTIEREIRARIARLGAGSKSA